MNLSADKIDNELIEEIKKKFNELPSNSYEALKKTLFDKNHQFQTIDNIEVPDYITQEILTKKLQDIQNQFREKVLDVLENPTKYNLNESEFFLTPLSELSGNTFVITKEKQKKYIEHIEMIRQINPVQINPSNAIEIAKKICYSALQVFTIPTLK